MAELKKEKQHRKKRLAAESEVSFANNVTNPFESDDAMNSQSEQIESDDAMNSRSEQSNQSDFAVPENVSLEDDWLESVSSTATVSQVSESPNYEPITDECVFSFNYKDSNIVSIRPYPIFIDKAKSITVFDSVSTLINDPGDAEPIFNEISPMVSNAGRDAVLQKMLQALKSKPELRKSCVRSVITKYIFCQILSNKNNPETVGKFVLFRIPYTLGKLFDEQGIYNALGDLVQPSNSKAIVINMTYDESRERKIGYVVTIENHELGQDKLVMTNSRSWVTVGSNREAYNAWKSQLYSSFKTIQRVYTKLRTYDLDKFTPQYAEKVLEQFQRRYNEVNAAANTSADTMADAISAGKSPNIQTANPFGSSSTPTSNPFVSNMGESAPINPFGASTNPSNGGFGDL